MKTVWIWKNVCKAFLVLLLVGIVAALFHVPPALGVLIGVAVGLWTAERWEPFRFE